MHRKPVYIHAPVLTNTIQHRPRPDTMRCVVGFATLEVGHGIMRSRVTLSLGKVAPTFDPVAYLHHSRCMDYDSSHPSTNAVAISCGATGECHGATECTSHGLNSACILFFWTHCVYTVQANVIRPFIFCRCCTYAQSSGCSYPLNMHLGGLVGLPLSLLICR